MARPPSHSTAAEVKEFVDVGPTQPPICCAAVMERATKVPAVVSIGHRRRRLMSARIILRLFQTERLSGSRSRAVRVTICSCDDAAMEGYCQDVEVAKWPGGHARRPTCMVSTPIHG